jgi:DNA-binding transcriptional LysR family regulator
LEKALGGNLLYRIPGKVSLTPLGQLLAEKARTLLAFKRETVAAVEQFQGKLIGELWVGGSNIPGEYLLPRKLGAFIKKHPEVKPVLRIGDSAGIVKTPDSLSTKFGRTKWCSPFPRTIPGVGARPCG